MRGRIGDLSGRCSEECAQTACWSGCVDEEVGLVSLLMSLWCWLVRVWSSMGWKAVERDIAVVLHLLWVRGCWSDHSLVVNSDMRRAGAACTVAGSAGMDEQRNLCESH